MTKAPRFDRGPAFRRRQRRRIWNWLRPILLLITLLLAWQAWNDPQLRDAVGLPMPAGVVVEGHFALCEEPGYLAHCVVDGDTFRMGNRRIRIEGIDAPEIAGECEAERQLARRATRDLQEWLNRGSFEMWPEEEAVRDQYARELQSPWRSDADGSRDYLADHMIAIGSAERFGWGDGPAWCD